MTRLLNTVHDTCLVFTWDAREAYQSYMLAVGGSGDCSAAEAVESDTAKHMGRYARTYSLGTHHSPSVFNGDLPGRTLSFFSWPGKPRPDGVFGPVVLAGCPWGSAAEYDATYAFLAVCGVTCNDAGADLNGIAGRARLAPSIGQLVEWHGARCIVASPPYPTKGTDETELCVRLLYQDST